MLVFRKILPIRIEIAVGHWTLSDKKCYMFGTHVSKQDILSCSLSLGIIYVENPADICHYLFLL